MSITHSKVSAKADPGDTSLVRPSDWNAAHVGNGLGWYDVTVYGAAGDGAADDTAEIQAAITACVAAGGGVVYLPAGDYHISAALTMGLAVGVRIIGASRDATVIRQMTRNVPIIKFDTADANGDEIRDLTLMYDDWQTLVESDAIALCFNREPAGVSLFWHLTVDHVRIYRAQTCIGYSGASGTQVTFDCTWTNLHLEAFSYRAIDLEPTNDSYGQPGHRFENLLIEILNIIPVSSAIMWFSGLTDATIDNLVVANSRNAILYAFGGSHVSIRGLHVEGAIVTNDFIRMFVTDDRGSLAIEAASVQVQMNNSDVAWFAGASADNGFSYVTLKDITFDITRNPGQLALVRCDDDGARVRVLGVQDVQSSMLIPFDPSQTTWAPQLLQLDNTFPSGEIRLGFDAAQVRVLTGTSSPESVVTAVVGSLFLRLDGGASTTLYVKTSGTGNTGWTAK